MNRAIRRSFLEVTARAVTPAAYPRVLIDDGLRRRGWRAFIFMNTDSVSRASSPLLFGLAPRGVFRAPDVATGAVGSYPTFSPLPNDASSSKTSRRFPCAMPPCYAQPAVYFLWHYP